MSDSLKSDTVVEDDENREAVSALLDRLQDA